MKEEIIGVSSGGLLSCPDVVAESMQLGKRSQPMMRDGGGGGGGLQQGPAPPQREEGLLSSVPSAAGGVVVPRSIATIKDSSQGGSDGGDGQQQPYLPLLRVCEARWQALNSTPAREAVKPARTISSGVVSPTPPLAPSLALSAPAPAPTPPPPPPANLRPHHLPWAIGGEWPVDDGFQGWAAGGPSLCCPAPFLVPPSRQEVEDRRKQQQAQQRRRKSKAPGVGGEEQQWVARGGGGKRSSNVRHARSVFQGPDTLDLIYEMNCKLLAGFTLSDEVDWDKAGFLSRTADFLFGIAGKFSSRPFWFKMLRASVFEAENRSKLATMDGAAAAVAVNEASSSSQPPSPSVSTSSASSSPSSLKRQRVDEDASSCKGGTGRWVEELFHAPGAASVSFRLRRPDTSAEELIRCNSVMRTHFFTEKELLDCAHELNTVIPFSLSRLMQTEDALRLFGILCRIFIPGAVGSWGSCVVKLIDRQGKRISCLATARYSWEAAQQIYFVCRFWPLENNNNGSGSSGGGLLHHGSLGGGGEQPLPPRPQYHGGGGGGVWC